MSPKATQPSLLLCCCDWGQLGLLGCGCLGPAGPLGAKPAPQRTVRPVVWTESGARGPASRNTALTPHPATPAAPLWGSWNDLGSPGRVAASWRKGWAREEGHRRATATVHGLSLPRRPPAVWPGAVPGQPRRAEVGVPGRGPSAPPAPSGTSSHFTDAGGRVPQHSAGARI